MPSGRTTSEAIKGDSSRLMADAGKASAIRRAGRNFKAMPSDSIMIPVTVEASRLVASRTIAGQGIPETFQTTAATIAQIGGSFSASNAVLRNVIGSWLP